AGYVLPSIHAWPPFFYQQPGAATQATQAEQWTRLILSYARHHRLFHLHPHPVHPPDPWADALANPRIKRSLKAPYLSSLLASLVAQGLAVYDPPKQLHSVLLYWRLPSEWAEILFDWASSTAQLNTILTFYEITNPPVPSPLVDLPLPLLRSAIAILAKSGRAQLIEGADGGGVRFFSPKPS
ncbi:hypothetical protein BOTBODRAFT_116654, partial [Botryobasidium botryosum FD-172 SS1]